MSKGEDEKHGPIAEVFYRIGPPERGPGAEIVCIRAYAWSDAWGEFVTADCAFRGEDRCWRMDRHKY